MQQNTNYCLPFPFFISATYTLHVVFESYFNLIFTLPCNNKRTAEDMSDE